MANEPYATVGAVIDHIPVSISYRIIELFSAGLYSSPNKAIEELVSNSYDAFATRADLFLPTNLADPDAAIWVVDDGAGMDVGGLFDLWQIARSNKRASENADRPPIGKFEIGKLATYVLAQRLTHISLRNGVVRAVTMDYAEIDPDASSESKIELAVRELSAEDLASALTPLRAMDGGSDVADRLLSAPPPASWTAVALSRLKPAASSLRLGRSDGIFRPHSQ